jgi:hypothetical protein
MCAPEPRDEVLDSFCFRCSRANASRDASPSPHVGQTVYVPWPGLVPTNTRILEARTQPLARMIYLPRPLPAYVEISSRREQSRQMKTRTQQDREDFTDYYLWLHERYHLLYLDRTPAKELARVHLAWCYAAIYQLAFSTSVPAEAAWKSFTEHQAALEEIGRRISFGEELVTTALALNTLRTDTLPDKLWAGFDDELEQLIADELDDHEENPDYEGFRTAYERIQPLVNLLPFKTNPQLARIVIWLLQPVVGSLRAKRLPMAVESRKHLNRILEFIEQAESTDAAQSRVCSLVDEFAPTGWRKMMREQRELVYYGHSVIGHPRYAFTGWPATPHSDTAQVAGGFLTLLWMITSREWPDDIGKDPDAVADQVNRISRKRFVDFDPIGQGTFVRLQPMVRGDCQYFHPYLTALGVESKSGENKEAQSFIYSAQSFVYGFEAIRQQLKAGRGFCCAVCRPREACRCQRMPELFDRLLHLSKEGLFGTGVWSPSPCRR